MKTAFRVGLYDEFWSMTFYEFRLAIQAYEESQKDEWRRTATHAAWIMNMWSKRTIKPAKLLGEKQLSKQELEAEMQRRVANRERSED